MRGVPTEGGVDLRRCSRGGRLCGRSKLDAMRGASAALTMCGLLAACPATNSGFSSGFGDSLPEMTTGSTSSGASVDSSTTSSGSNVQTSEDSTASSSSSSTTLPLQDLGGQPDFGPLAPPGCKGKI